MTHASSGASSRLVCFALLGILGLYGLAALAGYPQQATALAVAAAEGKSPQEAGSRVAEEVQPLSSQPAHPPLGMMAPFVLLLLAIAVLPLIPWTAPWWESNLHRFYVAAVLSGATLLYYLLGTMPVVAHWPGHAVVSSPLEGLNWAGTGTVLVNALLGEYFPFIVLLLALYTISGGIRIEGDLAAHPRTNALFLIAGAVLANFIGTTGAAMLLIRPLLETNSERRHVRHTVIFFIFVVCNCGGCLLPLGDPPLFLGYLQGVPFLWTIALWPEWLFVNGLLVAIYYLWDRFWAYPQETPQDIARDETRVRRLQFSGLWPNAWLLAGVVLSVALLDPCKPLPGTMWHPWMYLREMTQLALILLSLWWGSPQVRQANQFNFGAILEVAALFFGIFICMQPPLQILHVRGPALGLTTPMHFFWASGLLSAVLDNAPTYLVFFATAKTLPATPAVAGVGAALLAGISLGSVLMGSMTYIGNGPNFMVKAIAEKSGIRMPSFFGYVAYSGSVLLPVFFLTTWLFLR